MAQFRTNLSKSKHGCSRNSYVSMYVLLDKKKACIVSVRQRIPVGGLNHGHRFAIVGIGLCCEKLRLMQTMERDSRDCKHFRISYDFMDFKLHSMCG